MPSIPFLIRCGRSNDEPDPSSAETKSIEIKTLYELDNTTDLAFLYQKLRSIEGLSANHVSNVNRQKLEISGTISNHQIRAIAAELGLSLDDLHILRPKWLKNHNGVTQLVFLCIYNEKMKA